ncbi:hypothetical protein [Robertmurraya sp. FSL R5-0851]|uniref:hypothetical protein n=1 Tax=Robertmurraya sp. FSL R5-0851 TaxID=2921584 RepID=UPI0030FAEEDB
MYLEYTVNARQVERKFQREMNKQGFYRTAKGNINRLVEYGKTHVFVITEKGANPIELERTSIRKAITFFFFKRTAIRSDFKIFSEFTSAMFAIIVHCFRDKSKLLKLKHGLFRVSLIGTRHWFSGLERSPDILSLLKSLGGKYVLFNYKSILESPNCLRQLDENDLFCICDSGAFSLFNQSKKDEKNEVYQPALFESELLDEMILEGYAQFINKHKSNPRILGFMPLDCIGNPQKTRENYKKLKELTDAHIYPVWQITDTLEELDRIVEKEPEMVAIGGCVPFLSSRKDFVRDKLKVITKRHPNVCFHGLGIANEMLLDFGIFSADSTAYLNARKWSDRKVYLPTGERIEAPVEMSTMEIIAHNIKFLLGLENLEESQLSLLDMAQIA